MLAKTGSFELRGSAEGTYLVARATVRVKDEDGSQQPGIVLNGPTEASSGEAFAVTLGLNDHVTEALAQDLTIAYDADKLTFVDAVSLDDFNHFAERAGQVEGFDRLIGVVDDELGEIHAKGRFVKTWRRGAEPHYEGGELLRVLGYDGREHVFDVLPELFIEAADHAEV